MFLLHEPYLPEVLSGGVLSIHGLLTHLSALGHAAEVVALRANGPVLGRLPRPMARRGTRLGSCTDETNGYPTHRAGNFLALRALARRRFDEFRPDVVVVQGAYKLNLIRIIGRRSPARVVIRPVTDACVHEMERDMLRSRPFAARVRGGQIRVVSNSRFTADLVSDRLGIASSVRYPLMSLTNRKPSITGLAGPVVFVNPVPEKGVEVALAVARLLPARRFVFQESWTLGDASWRALQDRLVDLPNVELRRRSLDFAAVLSETSILFMPSQWDEAFGRVAVEANAHGVPVVASRVGGLTEALGEAGAVLDRDSPPELWAAALEGLLVDMPTYERARRAATANAARPEFDPAGIVRGFLSDFGESPS
jgi:glycosyltransferase involved in cell wall biosynthesis